MVPPMKFLKIFFLQNLKSWACSLNRLRGSKLVQNKCFSYSTITSTGTVLRTSVLPLTFSSDALPPPCCPSPVCGYTFLSSQLFSVKIAACICGGHLITLAFVTVFASSRRPPRSFRIKILKIFIFILEQDTSVSPSLSSFLSAG